ncbi:MAG: histidine phosphatase family protein [Myxococcales bacterium]|nr:histidine phosphatase family protein [Myxococcales bacterium]MCB9703874.1 histidine phosphatase family protein [Myxococcales bacterium]
MPRLVAALIRHGAYHQPPGVPSALLPHPLTAEGSASALALGEALAARERAGEWTIDPVIDTSSLRRAWETGERIAEALTRALGRDFVVSQHDALCERSLGAMANLTVSAIEALIADDPRHQPLPPGWKALPNVRLPVVGAESLLEAGARVATHIEGRLAPLARDLQRDTLRLFISHGAALRLAAVNLGTLRLDEVPGLSMYHCSAVFLDRDPGGTYRHTDGAWKVRRRGEEARD